MSIIDCQLCYQTWNYSWAQQTHHVNLTDRATAKHRANAAWVHSFNSSPRNPHGRPSLPDTHSLVISGCVLTMRLNTTLNHVSIPHLISSKWIPPGRVVRESAHLSCRCLWALWLTVSRQTNKQIGKEPREKSMTTAHSSDILTLMNIRYCSPRWPEFSSDFSAGGLVKCNVACFNPKTVPHTWKWGVYSLR